MANRPTESVETQDVASLRRRAEEKFRANETATLETHSPEETKQLLYELRVHQIELEMQNEELRRTQNELERSRTRYFDLYNLAPVGYLTLSEQGMIQEANLTAASMLGVERAALVKQPITEHILDEDQDIYYLRHKQLLETGCELRMVKTDGTAFWAHLAASAEEDPSTNTRQCAEPTPAIRVVLSDISERKQAEETLQKETLERLRTLEELHEKNQLLLQQSRQAAMGEMIGNIAHQWRQPLNSLGLVVQQLLLFYDMGEFNREFLEQNVSISKDLIKHMSTTIDDFRNFFSPEKEKLEFKVMEVIASTLSLIEDSFKNHHIANEVVAKGDPVIFGYKNEYGQVLLNILNNARDALTDRSTEDPKVTITIIAEDNRAVVTVSDNAGGIPEEIIDKIFDPYFTTKGPQHGTGVGLFMSKTIIEKNMGGKLSARNTADGAEFRIEV